MMLDLSRKIEFDLKIVKSRDKNTEDRPPYTKREDSKPEWEIIEELSFKSLSAKEVLRKLIDYL